MANESHSPLMTEINSGALALTAFAAPDSKARDIGPGLSCNQPEYILQLL